MQKKRIQMKMKLFKKTLLLLKCKKLLKLGVWLSTQEKNSHSLEVGELQIETWIEWWAASEEQTQIRIFSGSTSPDIDGIFSPHKYSQFFDDI